jgi:hypothetical protein
MRPQTVRTIFLFIRYLMTQDIIETGSRYLLLDYPPPRDNEPLGLSLAVNSPPVPSK